jgi:hypothetical protein
VQSTAIVQNSPNLWRTCGISRIAQLAWDSVHFRVEIFLPSTANFLSPTPYHSPTDSRRRSPPNTPLSAANVPRGTPAEHTPPSPEQHICSTWNKCVVSSGSTERPLGAQPGRRKDTPHSAGFASQPPPATVIQNGGQSRHPAASFRCRGAEGRPGSSPSGPPSPTAPSDVPTCQRIVFEVMIGLSKSCECLDDMSAGLGCVGRDRTDRQMRHLVLDQVERRDRLQNALGGIRSRIIEHKVGAHKIPEGAWSFALRPAHHCCSTSCAQPSIPAPPASPIPRALFAQCTPSSTPPTPPVANHSRCGPFTSPTHPEHQPPEDFPPYLPIKSRQQSHLRRPRAFSPWRGAQATKRPRAVPSGPPKCSTWNTFPHAAAISSRCASRRCLFVACPCRCSFLPCHCPCRRMPQPSEGPRPPASPIPPAPLHL